MLCDYLQQQLDCVSVLDFVSTMQRCAAQVIHFVYLLLHHGWSQGINLLAQERTFTPPKMMGGKASVRPAEAAMQTMVRYAHAMRSGHFTTRASGQKLKTT